MKIKLIIKILSIAAITARTCMVAADDDGKWEKSEKWYKWEKPGRWSNWGGKMDNLKQTERDIHDYYQVDSSIGGNTYELSIKGANLRGVAIVQGNENHVSVTTDARKEQKLMQKSEVQVAGNPPREFITVATQGEHLNVVMSLSSTQNLVTMAVQGDANHVYAAKEAGSSF